MPKATSKRTIQQRRSFTSVQNLPRSRRNNSRPHYPTRRPTNTIRVSRSPQKTAVHRRLALFPNVLKTNKSPWLSGLSWFGSIALKLFKMTLSAADDLTATSVTIGSGSTILLGPGDFASFSPFATTLTETKDRQTTALRALPFERFKLPKVHVKIVPTVDLGQRGGMYAAVLIPADQNDAEQIGINNYLKRFNPSYDVIIKHPNAVLSPVTRTVTLSCMSTDLPRDIHAFWVDEDKTYKNVYPSYILMVAFSDLASSAQTDVDDNYSVSKSLFEVHLTGSLNLYEPGEITVSYEQGESRQSSWSTSILSVTDSSTTTLTIGHHEYEVPSNKFVNGRIDLRQLPLEAGLHVLKIHDRSDLELELRAHHLSVGSG